MAAILPAVSGMCCAHATLHVARLTTFSQCPKHGYTEIHSWDSTSVRGAIKRTYGGVVMAPELPPDVTRSQAGEALDYLSKATRLLECAGVRAEAPAEKPTEPGAGITKPHVDAAFEHLKQAMNLLSRGPCSFYLDKLFEYRDALFERCCPFKVGDRVALTRTRTDYSGAPGWRSCQHFLIAGAVGTVKAVEFSKGWFEAHVVFDNDSWLDTKGVAISRPPEERSAFMFTERWLRVVAVRAPAIPEDVAS